MIFLYFCLLVLKSLSQMAFYFSNLILQTAIEKNLDILLEKQVVLGYSCLVLELE